MCFPVSGFAAPTFGPEFEFTSQIIEQAWANSSGSASAKIGNEEVLSADELINTVASLCAKTRECTIERGDPLKGGVLVIFKDKWWFQISVDPGCVEIQAKPSTISQMQRYKERMDKYIFQAAYKSGLFIDEHQGAGHLNIGFFSLFGERKDTSPEIIDKRFLNFYIDFHNHLELASGALGRRDNVNARAFDLLKEKFKTDVQRYIWAADKLNKFNKYYEAVRFFSKILVEANPGKRLGVALHYQSINIEHIAKHNPLSDKDARLEIRSLYSQESAEQFILTAKLFLLRNNFLKKQDKTVPLIALDKKKYSDIELVSRFYVYVTEAGGSFQKYKQLLPKNLHDITPDHFVLGDKRLDLDSKEDFETLKSHVLFIANSKWIQNKFDRYFLDSKNYNKKYYFALLEEILKCAERQKQLGQFNFSDLYLKKFGEYKTKIESHFSNDHQIMKSLEKLTQEYLPKNNITVTLCRSLFS